MRLEAPLLCLSLAACSSVSENVISLDVARPPDEKVLEGMKVAGRIAL